MKFIGSRDEPQDRSGTWPSKTLAKAIEKHGPKNDVDKRIRMNLVDCVDVTKEAQETPRSFPRVPQIVRFAPDVCVAGLGLLRERRNEEKWGGVLVRALESKDREHRCLQYFYVYLRQNGVVSAFWNILLPIALGLWGIYVLDFLLPVLGSGNIISMYPELLLTVPMIPFLSAILPHYNEFLEGQRFSFRSMTFLPVYFILEASIVYVPFMAFVLMALGAFFGVYWLAEWRGWAGTSHNMDYVPVFVYLKKRAGVWLFDHAVWDVWHYHTGSTKNPFNIFRHEAFEPFTGLTLTIDNPWHSVYRGSPALRGQKYTGVLALLFIATFSGAILLIIEIIQYGGFAYLLPLLCTFFVASGLLLARRPYPLLTMEEQMTKLTAPEARLDDMNKLVALWNLYEIKNPTFLTQIRLRIVRARIRERKKQLTKKLREFDRLRILDGGPVGKIWNVYQMKGVEAAQEITSEEELTLKQQQELDSDNLHEELDLLDGYMEKLEGYDRVKKNPRLVIVQKMQNPFNKASDFMDSFRDTEEHLYSLIPFEDDTRSFSR